MTSPQLFFLRRKVWSLDLSSLDAYALFFPTKCIYGLSLHATTYFTKEKKNHSKNLIVGKKKSERHALQLNPKKQEHFQVLPLFQ